ncbi:uncharacterized protein EV154DRAFT_426819 [Mucor mucedo]|uniref:uncharacterized protein n=1 Tax=Mucor mucedo TaxID=29922 RepID=UPI00221FF09D|nr:uncharacterized protein EV154DRAFT_426819 [Mucor mucedo]KAI7887813.1 hypothetical protein EV154DRAFT_426819 [Mucor mucedo]
MNPFDCNFQQRITAKPTTDKWTPSPTLKSAVIYTSPEPEMTLDTVRSPETPPMSASESPSSASSFSSISEQTSLPYSPQQSHTMINPQFNSFSPEQQEQNRRSSRIQTKQPFFSEYLKENDGDFSPRSASVQSGRKRRIVFEGDDAEDRRKKFLERNRVAAYKCRQKKKNWMQDLEQKAEIQNHHNEELRSLVAQLKEESMYLRNLLLTHGNCDCDSVQAYLRKTSVEITRNVQVLPVAPPIRRHSTYAPTMPAFEGPFNPMPPFQETSTGLTPFLNTVINKSEPSNDYFSQSHADSA